MTLPHVAVGKSAVCDLWYFLIVLTYFLTRNIGIRIRKCVSAGDSLSNEFYEYLSLKCPYIEKKTKCSFYEILCYPKYFYEISVF